MTYPLLLDKMHRVLTACRNAAFAPTERPVLFGGPDGQGANHGAMWDGTDSYWGGYYYYCNAPGNVWLMLELVYEHVAARPNPLGERSWLSESGNDGGYLAFVTARVGADDDGQPVVEWSTDRFFSMTDDELVGVLGAIPGVV